MRKATVRSEDPRVTVRSTNLPGGRKRLLVDYPDEYDERVRGALTNALRPKQPQKELEP